MPHRPTASGHGHATYLSLDLPKVMAIWFSLWCAPGSLARGVSSQLDYFSLQRTTKPKVYTTIANYVHGIYVLEDRLLVFCLIELLLGFIGLMSMQSFGEARKHTAHVVMSQLNSYGTCGAAL